MAENVTVAATGDAYDLMPEVTNDDKTAIDAGHQQTEDRARSGSHHRQNPPNRHDGHFYERYCSLVRASRRCIFGKAAGNNDPARRGVTRAGSPCRPPTNPQPLRGQSSLLAGKAWAHRVNEKRKLFCTIAQC